MLYTTLALCKAHRACAGGYSKLKESLPPDHTEDTPIPLSHITQSNRVEDAIWALRATTTNSDTFARLFACECAEHVLPIFEEKYPNDKRPRQAIEVARRFAVGQASQEELLDARNEARDAGWAAYAAVRDAAFDAARAARNAARAAAYVVAYDAAFDAAFEAVKATQAAARDAAWQAEQIWQTNKFLEMLEALDKP